MKRPTTRNGLRLGFAVLLLMAIGTVAPRSVSSALGPVIAITPYEVGGGTCCVEDPSLSGRGEAAGVYDAEMRETGFVFLDSAGPDPMTSGLSIAVSGNGCVALWARENGSTDPNANVSIGVTNRCGGGERVLFNTNTNYASGSSMALNFDGRFGVAVLGVSFASEFEHNRVVRIDTSNGSVADVPFHGYPYNGWDPQLGVDISDDGSVVAAVETGNASATTVVEMRDVVVWNAGAADSQIVSGPVGTAGAAAFPSLSADGRFVAFASTRNMAAGGETQAGGPWVYVADRSNGTRRLVSPGNGIGYQPSLSRDASQVAFVVGPPIQRLCLFNRQTFADVEYNCPGSRIDVAYGPSAGFTAPFAAETISILANGAQGGTHLQPALSGNGRWVAWISDAGTALLGVNDESLSGNQAFTRRRDPALSVDPLDFGVIAAGTNLMLATTVRNSGRTSVSLDSITASPGQFAIQGGGSCVGGSLLPPGATCTVNVRFTAPGAAGTTNGSITIAESGYDPISAAAPLTGVSSVTTTQPGTTTTTQPGVIVTTTTRPPPGVTTTTVPGNVSLIAEPAPLDFGQVPFGIASPIKTLTVTNTGTTAGTINTALGGTNPDDFFVAVNNCNEVTLAPGASCTMDIMMIALAGGNRSAELTLTAGGNSGSVDLLGQARFIPRLLANPGAITTDGITTLVGQGFPPGGTFTVHIGGTDQTLTATADTQGLFRIPYTAFNKLELGSYLLTVDPLPDVFDLVRGNLAVVLPTFQPQGPGGPVFGSVLFGDTLIVTRG